jgi:transposase
MQWTRELIDKVYAQITEKAARDPEFAKRLLAEPKPAIEKTTGYALPDGYEIKVVEENGTYRVVNPDVSELNDDELDEVAGGGKPIHPTDPNMESSK